jgi:hypothetical protein
LEETSEEDNYINMANSVINANTMLFIDVQHTKANCWSTVSMMGLLDG